MAYSSNARFGVYTLFFLFIFLFVIFHVELTTTKIGRKGSPYISDFQPGFRGTSICQGFRSWPVKIT